MLARDELEVHTNDAVGGYGCVCVCVIGEAGALPQRKLFASLEAGLPSGLLIFNGGSGTGVPRSR